jgi:HK97 family phage major capsid protein
MSDNENQAVELKEAVIAFKSKATELESFLKSAKPEMEGNTKEVKEVVAKSETMAKEINEIATRISEIEQKAAESVKRGNTLPMSMGEVLAKSDSLREFAAGNAQRARVTVENGGFFKNTIVNADATTAPDRQPGVIPGPFRRLTLRDVVPSGLTGLNVVETTREASVTYTAAETAEGNSKPETDITFDLVTTNIRTIATFLRLSRQIVADAPTVASYINTRLAHLVDRRLDNQVINGNASGANLSGIANSGNFTAFTPLSGATEFDNIAIIAGLLGQADYDLSAIILNPHDAWKMQRAKGSANDHYFSDPYSMAPLSAWGVPIVISNAVTQGKIVAADFTQSHFLWNRSGVVVEMFEQDSDNVTKNLVTVRAELRAGLETRVPAACRYGNLVA